MPTFGLDAHERDSETVLGIRFRGRKLAIGIGMYDLRYIAEMDGAVGNPKATTCTPGKHWLRHDRRVRRPTVLKEADRRTDGGSGCFDSQYTVGLRARNERGGCRNDHWQFKARQGRDEMILLDAEELYGRESKGAGKIVVSNRGGHQKNHPDRAVPERKTRKKRMMEEDKRCFDWSYSEENLLLDGECHSPSVQTLNRPGN
ncbi:hypothetical protein FB45DRAFT_872244 [Roridomyces roridus]|uniref:Uncharacterized protein n=1 Tax=Roridomyces roridus TaxID=1738132 RepID=A0AAD7BDG7_9AGAR|nr:hypothetical protein FB45DRAFT_872244 [Roridomyces roridus]